jgi:tellurite resistance protein TerC
MDIQTSLFLIFGITVTLFLVADLGFFNKTSHRISFKAAIYQSLFWVAISVGFASLIHIYMGNEMAVQYMSAYVTEKMLSVDNLFVIMLIFSYFGLEEKYHHRALFYGVLGAIVFRAIFIGAGAMIVGMFHWVLYIFGAILLYTGIKLFNDKKEEHVDFEKNQVVKLARRYLPFTVDHHNGKFFSREGGKLMFTSLFLIVLLIEVTDIIFAVDSIPAAFAISQDPFIIFTSNIFAILGLRSLFFVLEGVMHRFHHLQKGLSFILVFIGAKMLLGIIDLHISSVLSFGIIMLALFLSIGASWLFPKKF